jgi:two-component system sensor histidine kinase BaeS
MKRSLKTKLILNFIAVALLTVVIVSLVLSLTSGQSLMNLVREQQTAQLAESVETFYASAGSLGGFYEYYLQSGTQRPDLQQPDLQQPGSFEQPGGFSPIRGVYGLVDTSYRAVMPTFEFRLGDIVPEERIKDAIAVEVNGKTVAWIMQDTKFEFNLNPEEELFLKRTNLAIGLAAGAGALASVGIGYLLATSLVKPIKRLTNASKALSKGNLEQQVPVTSQDELGQLTTTFNQMSTELYNADQQRKRLTADITHDLSTPLQIISGYMEMLEDHEVTLTPQRIEIIKTEIDHLRRLVSDLTTLSQVDASGLEIQFAPVKPCDLLQRIYETYQPIAARQGVTLVLDAPEDVPEIPVDEGRMQQVIKNLLDNALRYTPQGGRITLYACQDERVELHVVDTGSGIDPEELPYVFDRFYRADRSRNGNTGKMGLGLAICKALVNAMGGEISAYSGGKDKGTDMVIKFDAGKQK